MPNTWNQAVKINKKNGNTLWQDVVKLEMKEIISLLEEHEGPVKDLIGFIWITGHLIFDVKLGENF